MFALGTIDSRDQFLTSGAALSSLVVVIDAGAGIVAADIDSAPDGCQVIGIAVTSAGAAGEQVRVRHDGSLKDSSFSFTPGDPLFVGAGGVLTHTPPTGINVKWSKFVGHAIAADEISIELGPSIFTE